VGSKAHESGPDAQKVHFPIANCWPTFVGLVVARLPGTLWI